MQINYTICDLIYKVMRISVIQLTIAAAFSCMAIARDNYAQQTLDREVTIHVKEVTLQKALEKLEKAAQVKFVYSRNYLNLDHTVTLDASRRKLGEVLTELLTPITIGFSAQDASDFIFLAELEKMDSTSQRVNTPSVEFFAAPAPHAVTGKVISGADNAPMPGVNVIVKGTTNGTSTDAEGKFSISADNENVLVFSFIGFKPFETAVGDRSEINVTLQEDLTNLDEVVVMGYGTTTKRLKTSSIARLTDEEISKQPVTNPLAALDGRLPGVYITQNTGTPGGSFTVRVRGQNSISSGNDPLYIVDGVPFTSTPMGSTYSSLNITQMGSPLNSINPADIESIEVLKDADATAIYGSRGANGVVLITTKKGKAGTTKVDFNVYTGVQQVTRTMDLLNTQQYLTMRKEAFKNDGVAMTTGTAQDLLVWDTTRYTDWQKLLIGNTAHTTDAQGSVSGGNSNTQFLIGGGFHRETTVFPGDFSYQKGSSHFNLTHTSADQKFKVSFSGSYVTDKNFLPFTDPTYIAMYTPPDAPQIYDANGKLNWGPANGNFSNPFAITQQNYKANTDNIVSNAMFSYKLFKGFQLKSSFGFTSLNMSQIGKKLSTSINPITASYTFPTSIFSNNSIKTWIIEPQAEYQKNIGLGKLTALVGTTFQQNINSRYDLTATGFSSDALMDNILSASKVVPSLSLYTQYKYEAVFGRLSYDWDGKYLVNLTARRDGSSRFGPNRRFATFGAAGAAWIFSKESFFTNSDFFRFISFGKIRGSYGTTGNDQIPDYGFMDLWSSTTYPYQGQSSLYPTRLYNPGNGWERNRKLEAGIELGFNNDKLQLSVSYYNNRSSNQLVSYPLPSTTGFSSIKSNLPAVVQNTGVEIGLTSTNLQTKALTWTTSFNLTVPRNQLVSYPNLAGSSYANTFVVGQPLSIVKAYHFTGVDPVTGVNQYQDVNGDSNLSFPSDLQALKKVTQDFYGGVQNSLQYKNWRLNFLIQYVKQQGRNYLYAWGNAPGMMNNQPAFVMNRWQKSGDVTDIQMFTQDYGSAAYNAFSNYSIGDNTVSDASFIRFKTVSLSYQFGGKWLEKAAMKNARIYLQAQNLFTITNYQGLDPESQSINIPPLRVITVGAQLTF